MSETIIIDFNEEIEKLAAILERMSSVKASESSNDTLVAAVLDWLHRATPDLMASGLDFLRTRRTTILEDTVSHMDVAQSILAALGPRSPLKEPQDVVQVILSELGPALLAFKEGNIDAVKAIVRRLRDPLQVYEFSVLIATDNRVAIFTELGGPNQLQLRDASCDEAAPRMELVGRVEAPTEERAAQLVETQIKCILGTCMSLGIAEPLPVVMSTLPVVTLKSDSDMDVFSVPLHPGVGSLASRIRFGIPADPNDLESQLLSMGDLAGVLGRRLQPLRSLLTSNSARAKELRNSASLLFDAVGAREFGMTIALSFMSMEAVLLEKSDTDSLIARLSEAVAYRLGTSATARQRLRAQIRKLYKARSVFVHTGEAPDELASRAEALGLAGDVLRRELEDLKGEVIE